MLIRFQNYLFIVLLISGICGCAHAKELSRASCEKIASCIFSNQDYAPSERIKVWNELRSNCSASWSYQKNLLDFYIKSDRLDEARSLIEEEFSVKKKGSGQNFKYLQWANIVVNIRDKLYDKARSNLDEYLKDESNLFEGYSLLGQLYFCEGEMLNFSKKHLEESERHYKKALQESTNSSEMARVYGELLVVVYHLKRSPEDVLKNFEKAWEYDPGKILTNKSACYVTVLSFLSKGNVGSAKHVLDLQEKLGLGLEYSDLSMMARKAISDHEKT